METSTTTRHIWASFSDYDLAAQAVAAFIDHGVPKERIQLITERVPPAYKSDADRDVISKAETGITTTTSGDAGVGAGKGTGIGLGIGILAGLAALAVPGFGLVVGGGALATAIAGAVGTTAAGALAGAVTGYLKDQGADDFVIKEVTDRIAAGDVLVNLYPDTDTLTEEEISTIIQKYQGLSSDMRSVGFEFGRRFPQAARNMRAPR